MPAITSAIASSGSLRRDASGVAVGERIRAALQARGPWTDHMVQKLRAEWKDRTSTALGIELGVTKNAVIGKARRIGLPAKGASNQHSGPHPMVHAPRVTLPAFPMPAPVLIADPPRAAASVLIERPAPPPREARPLPDRPCQWPTNNGEGHRWTFCDAPVVGSGPYCAGCRRLAYVRKGMPDAAD